MSANARDRGGCLWRGHDRGCAAPAGAWFRDEPGCALPKGAWRGHGRGCALSGGAASRGTARFGPQGLPGLRAPSPVVGADAQGTSESRPLCGCWDTATLPPPRGDWSPQALPTTAGYVYTTQPGFANISPCAVCWGAVVAPGLSVLVSAWTPSLPRSHFLFLFGQTPESPRHRPDTPCSPLPTHAQKACVGQHSR